MSDTLAEGWFDPETATFGDRVAGAREAAAMTQKQLAKRLGVKLVTLQDWENDINEPRANKLQMLAGVLNVSLTWLLDGSGDGIDAPEDVQPINDELGQILAELRELKARANRTANRLGSLEKRLRGLAREGQLG
ncbi:MAG: putative transcription factor [Rhodobacteraceae bacterium HLUCCO07]|uniref:helix-turn-helix domain-containing protein n=1 Tax=Aquicoccus sp. TaxID=2055851 RepID=UPI0006DBD431|nr:MAG: putative transcription factor [Rhodobacteraceae bacterium HLUCCO07]